MTSSDIATARTAGVTFEAAQTLCLRCLHLSIRDCFHYPLCQLSFNHHAFQPSSKRKLQTRANRCANDMFIDPIRKQTWQCRLDGLQRKHFLAVNRVANIAKMRVLVYNFNNLATVTQPMKSAKSAAIMPLLRLECCLK
jgi:hypothetical protein